MRRCGVFLMGLCLTALAVAAADATTYEIGPGKTYENVVDMPWESLSAGDTVLIYYRATPYKEKFILTGVGTESQPITVSGVPGPGGELPVLDGQDAVSRLALETGSEARGLITMQQDTAVPPPCRPQYIIVENLEIKNASYPYTFTDDSGAIQAYPYNAAALWSVDGKHVTVRNCYFHDCGNGLFTYSLDAGADCWTEDWLAEGNYITQCGYGGRNTEHDIYTESLHIVFQFNHIGPPRGTDELLPIGNALKDRSAGTVVRYNWIEGGNRCLDLVDAEDSDTLGSHPDYEKTFVYGNVLIELPDAGNRQVVNFGYDMHGIKRIKLYLYNNTLVSYRGSATETRTTVVRNVGDSSGFVDLRNCVLFTTADGSQLEITNDSRKGGPVNLRNCAMKPGYDLVGPSGGTVNDYGGHFLSSDMGFVDFNNQDFHLASGSGCIDAGTTLHDDCASNPVTMQYVKHQDGETRPVDSTLDIGGFEYESGGPPPDLVITTTSLPNGQVNVYYSQTLQATGGVTPYAWSIISGSLPSGLSLNSSTGVISGTPTTEQTANFTVQVTDSQQPPDSDTQALSITIDPQPSGPTITTTSLPDGQVKVNYSAFVEATGGTLPYTWSIVSGSLPKGLNLNSSTGEISGKPGPPGGTSNFTVRCTDAAMQYDEKALSITIN